MMAGAAVSTAPYWDAELPACCCNTWQLLQVIQCALDTLCDSSLQLSCCKSYNAPLIHCATAHCSHTMRPWYTVRQLTAVMQCALDTLCDSSLQSYNAPLIHCATAHCSSAVDPRILTAACCSFAAASGPCGSELQALSCVCPWAELRHVLGKWQRFVDARLP